MKTPAALCSSLAAALLLLAGVPAAAQSGSPPSVALSSSAFSESPTTGEVVRLEAAASGGVTPYFYEWDLDGDALIDRRSSVPTIEATYPRTGTFQVSVAVSDADGLQAEASQTLIIRGPRLLVEPIGELLGPTNIDPGDPLTQFVRITNTGDATQPAGLAMFVPSPIRSIAGPSPGGYVATTADEGYCDYGWIDLVEGEFSVPALVTSSANGNPLGALEDARSSALSLSARPSIYNQLYSQAVMSTNGYLSFDARDDGAAHSPTCGSGLEAGSFGPQLRPFFDDLRVAGTDDQPAAGGGLRYRFFDVCPRVGADGVDYPCHVFSWTGMQRSEATTLSSTFDFQAIVYFARGEIAFQYRGAIPQADSLATVGIANADASEAFNAYCPAGNSVDPDNSICFFQDRILVETIPAAVTSRSLQAVPELAIGESVELPFFIYVDDRARCGQRVSVDYLGTTWDDGQSFEPKNVINSKVADRCVPPQQGPIVLPPAPPPPFPRRTGLYFNPARPGNGQFNYFRSTGYTSFTRILRTESYAGAWYTGLSDRTPVWYTLEGSLVESTGELMLRKFSNPAAPEGFAPVSEVAGRAWTSRIDTSNVVFAWQLLDGSTGIEMMQGGTPLFGGVDHTQSWFAPTEPGWGLAIEAVATGAQFEFFGAFLYDDTGAPRWVTGDVANFNGGLVNLAGFRPHCPACPWIVDWNLDGVLAGTLQIEYQSQFRATLNTAISLPPAYSGSWDRNDLDIQSIVAPPAASD